MDLASVSQIVKEMYTFASSTSIVQVVISFCHRFVSVNKLNKQIVWALKV